MKKLVIGLAVGVGLVGGVGVSSASADSCHGQIVSDIASTWPFAHENRDFFPPPKGALAKFTEELTPFDNPGEFNQDIKAFCKS